MNWTHAREGTAGELVGAAAVAGLVGLMVPGLSPAGVFMLMAVIAGGVVTVLVRHRFRAVEAPFLLTIGLTMLGVLAITWNGVRGPANLPLSDVFILLALVGLAFIVLRGDAVVPLPAWLLGGAIGLLAAGLVAELFVMHPPPLELPPGLGPDLHTLARDNDYAAIARVELAMLCVPVLIGTVASTPRRARLIAGLWLAGALVSATVALLDLLVGTGIGASLNEIAYGNRQVGLTTHPNHLGLICGMTFPLALLRVLSTTGIARALWLCAAGLLVIAVLSSGSRTGLIVLACGYGFLAIFLREHRAKLVLAGIGALAAFLLAAIIAGSQLSGVDRLIGNSDTSLANESRVQALERSFSVVQDHFLTGVGFARLPFAHNVVLQLLESGGILALASFSLIAVGAVRLGIGLGRNSRLPRESRQLASALIACICAWLVGTLLAPQLLDRYLYVPLGVLLALSVAARSRAPEAGSEEAPSRGPPAREALERSPVGAR